MVCFNNGSPHVQPTKLAKCIETRQLGMGTTTIDLSTLVDVFSQVSRNGHMNDVRGAYVWLHACRSFLDGCSLDILGYVHIVNSCIATSARETHQYPGSIQTPDYEVTLCGVCSACTSACRGIPGCHSRHLRGKSLNGHTMILTATWRLLKPMVDQLRAGTSTRHRIGYDTFMCLFRCLMHRGGGVTLRCLRGNCSQSCTFSKQ